MGVKLGVIYANTDNNYLLLKKKDLSKKNPNKINT